MNLQKQRLIYALDRIEQEDYPVQSRVHELHLTEGVYRQRSGETNIVGGHLGEMKCYVKREDELGGLISGSKIRKYRSLIPAIKKKGYKNVALIGGQHSNNILGLSSLLIENGIKPILFLLKSTDSLIGNALFSHLLVPKDDIFYIDRSEWHEVEKIASRLLPCVIPEGGSTEDSIAGLATLALDILRNEEQLGHPFKEIFIDAGTGLTAASLISAFGFLKKDAHRQRSGETNIVGGHLEEVHRQRSGETNIVGGHLEEVHRQRSGETNIVGGHLEEVHRQRSGETNIVGGHLEEVHRQRSGETNIVGGHLEEVHRQRSGETNIVGGHLEEVHRQRSGETNIVGGHLEEVHLHVMLAASSKDAFLSRLEQTQKALEALTQESIPNLPKFTLHSPPTGKSFGSTNATIFRQIRKTARKEGFFLDPIYGSKLYLLLEAHLKENLLSGPVLFIHSGGLFSLSGFQTQLAGLDAASH